MNLKPFKITLPVNKAGKPSGKPHAIGPVLPTTQVKPYFVQNKDGTADFLCPLPGATTANTTRTRCELGEIKTWNAATGGVMTFEMTVLETSKRVNLAQTHAEVGEPFKLALEGGTFDLVDEQSANGKPVHYKLSPSVKYSLGQKIVGLVWMDVKNQGCDITVNGITGKASWPLTSWWKNNKRQMKFRLPIYYGSDEKGKVRVRLHSVKVTH